MPTLLSQATLHDLPVVEALVAAFHAEADIRSDETLRLQALRPLLRGSPLGEIHLIGPTKAPIGYAAVSHGYSIEFGGPDAFLDEFYLRPAVRGKGVGSDVLHQLSKRLRKLGTRALHLEVNVGNAQAAQLYSRNGFVRRSEYEMMTKELMT